MVITASNTASAAAWHAFIACGDRTAISEFVDGRSMSLLFPGAGIGRAAAAQIARTKMAASDIQRIAMNQIPITALRLWLVSGPRYFNGATFTSFFSMPLVATVLPFVVLQQAADSAPQDEHV